MEDFEDDSGTIFRDVTLLALAAFVAMVLMLLPFINPGAEAEVDNTSISDPGNVIVELLWPPELDSDIDLWVKAPHAVPVGFPNKGNEVVNLLRDDLGLQGDFTKLNYEVSYSRGVPVGEYAVNVHFYRNAANVVPIPVSIAVSVKPNAHESAKQLLATTINLVSEGQELTAFRFQLDEKGRVREGSVHNLPKPLRSDKRQ